MGALLFFKNTSKIVFGAVKFILNWMIFVLIVIMGIIGLFLEYIFSKKNKIISGKIVKITENQHTIYFDGGPGFVNTNLKITDYSITVLSENSNLNTFNIRSIKDLKEGDQIEGIL